MPTFFVVVMDHQWQAAHRQYKFNMDGLHVTISGKGHVWTVHINTIHGFSVELSPCMCSHSSTGWRNSCNSHVCDTYSFEDLSTYISSSLAYYTPVTVHSEYLYSWDYGIITSLRYLESLIFCSVHFYPSLLTDQAGTQLNQHVSFPPKIKHGTVSHTKMIYYQKRCLID